MANAIGAGREFGSGIGCSLAARREAAFQYGSRLVRMLALARERVNQAAAAAGAAGLVGRVVHWFA